MKTTLKILILFIACVLAIGGIMVYAKTKVAPPENVDPIDQYEKNIKGSLSQLAGNDNISEIDSIFSTTIIRIFIFNDENKITNSVTDENLNSLLNVYTPKFLDFCFSSFKASTWYDNDHLWMNDRVRYLSNLKLFSGNNVLNKSSLDSLNLVNTVISRYRHAKNISKTSSFTGLSKASSVIKEAQSYIEDPYLSNNTKLVSDLKDVKGRIHDSHFNYITGQVNKLSNYTSIEESYFMDTLMPKVEGSIKEYENNASSLYGTRRSTDRLWSQARNTCKDAVNHYNKQRTNNSYSY